MCGDEGDAHGGQMDEEITNQGESQTGGGSERDSEGISLSPAGASYQQGFHSMADGGEEQKCCCLFKKINQ